MPTKTKRPESPLIGEPWPLKPDEELAMFLQMEYERFQSDPSHALSAFSALAFATTAVWQKEQSYSPQDTVTIPMWVAESLTAGFLLYKEAAEDGCSKTLGEAYGIEGGGQGKLPQIKISAKELRDIRIATKIAQRKLAGIKIEAAIQERADATELSLSQIRRI